MTALGYTVCSTVLPGQLKTSRTPNDVILSARLTRHSTSAHIHPLGRFGYLTDPLSSSQATLVCLQVDFSSNRSSATETTDLLNLHRRAADEPKTSIDSVRGLRQGFC